MTRASLFQRAAELAPRLVELRRHLHRNPELSYHEQKTGDFIQAELERHGFECRRVAGAGVLARLPGAGPGPVVALRAELDALPIQEENEVDYRSVNAGVMHACGHDAHMTMALGAGLLLKEMSSLPGSTVLLFQPAEEVPPGGARQVIDEGVLDDYGVSAIFALHVDPRYPAGTLLLKPGPLMAASDRFRLTIAGRGGHGGYPHMTVDPIVVSAQVILALQTIVSRRIEPVEAGVISIGMIEAGSADNVIPDEVHMAGTLRSHDPDVRRQLPELIRETAAGIAAASGARSDFEYLPGHPGLANDPDIVAFIREAVVSEIGADRVVELPKAIMGGEDFSHYLDRYPGAFLRLGVRNEVKDCTASLHNPRFNLDEAALPVGAASLAAIAAAWRRRPPVTQS